MTPAEFKSSFKWGVEYVFKRLLWFVLLFIIGTLIIDGLPLNRDSTDGDWPNRSGMIVLTDQKTGCQYLSKGPSLIPRMGQDGKRHLGCKHAK